MSEMQFLICPVYSRNKLNPEIIHAKVGMTDTLRACGWTGGEERKNESGFSRRGREQSMRRENGEERRDGARSQIV